MFYVKNVPVWERWVRILMGVILMGSTISLLNALGHGWLGIAAGVIGLMAFLTGLVGFCPVCAIAGRKLPDGDKT